MDLKKFWVFDIETYKEAFTFSIVRADGFNKKTFVCSAFQNDFDSIIKCLRYLQSSGDYLVGFNSLGFDYPVVHQLMSNARTPKTGIKIAELVFDLAQKQIQSFSGEGFGNMIKVKDQYTSNLDLYKIHHFDNKAKATCLKMIEFNLRMNNLKDLPYDIRETLTEEMILEIVLYNEHDVEATRLFFVESLPQIEFRIKLTEKYNRDFLNHNDGKIGKDYFKMKLEEEGVKLYKYKDGKKVMAQTPRSFIDLGQCLFSYYNFREPAFEAVRVWFSNQKITETKGVFINIPEHKLGEVAKYAEMIKKKKKFKAKPSDSEIQEFKKEYPMGWIEEEELKSTEYLFDANGEHVTEYHLFDDGSPNLSKKPKKVRVPKKSYWACWNQASTLNIVVNGFRFDFGVGGIHGSISNKIAKQTKKYDLIDADVASMYPNIAISNRVYPEHLGEGFCDIYQDVYEQRKSFAKNTPENAMLKLALNSVYGDSNSEHSIFYDPAYTMKITVNGQLSLCLLADMLFEIQGLKIIQANTDGLTVAVPKTEREHYFSVCKQWEKIVGLQLEYADYEKMFIRDVNNYIALYTNGKIKRKGAYEYEKLGWDQNHSSLVIPMVAEAYMLKGVSVKDFLEDKLKNGDIFDFLLRTKVDKSSKLVLSYERNGEVVDVPQQRICRYYPSKSGGQLVKIMKPLEGNTEYRRMKVEANYLVKTCNDMKDFDGDIDLNYYINEVEKLIIH